MAWFRPVAWVALLATAWAQSACSGDSGLIVVVTRDPQSTPVDVNKLSFFVGIKRVEGDGAGFFVKDEESSVELTINRDLESHPYRLLLHDGTGGAQPAEVRVAVRGFKGETLVGLASLEPPQAFVADEIIERTVTLIGNRPVELKPTGCLKWQEGADWPSIGVDGDVDCDGDAAAADCDDYNGAVGPSRKEVCDNGVDDNCDELIDTTGDADGDQVDGCAGDCDDADPEVKPGMTEVCDGKDNDCSGACDDGFDLDGDLYTTCGTRTDTCEPAAAADCNDEDPAIHPDADEICDGEDNDCNGTCDDPDVLDGDGDGFTECGTKAGVCGAPDTALADCDNALDTVYPGAPELCDGYDNNCDGRPLPGAPCFIMQTPSGSTDPVCHQGYSACDDSLADGTPAGWQDCVADASGPPYPGDLCTAYDACLTDPLPYQCAVAAAVDKTWTCKLSYTNVGLCQEPSAPLPDGGTGTCTWSIGGGINQAHYVVGLSDATHAAGPVLQSCTGWFEITEAEDTPPQADHVLLSLVPAPGATAVIHLVKIEPLAVSLCEGPALTCTLPMP